MKLTQKNKQFIIGLSLSLILLLSFITAMIVGKYKYTDTLVALSVGQLCIAIMWMIIRVGLFSTSSLGMRRYTKSHLHKKHEKIGVYNETKKSQIKVNEYNSTNDIEENSSYKSKIGIYTMFIIGFIELLISIIVIFA
ncbi:DUF3899 domain-containing protein [Mycoplasma marinum]|uniref:DUF3899 domain-containing protein n=1 Tax=Mycoplasma marinum TaxID=1937190 RepID=A0A4R0XK70_9MOLU|nr:DUF3899 domain-containing protein [Mycoplasma marinum]TCG11046.1 hypothetical protein C4B24_03110 [Mycoplasma marinum]